MPTDHLRQHEATAAVGLGLIAYGAQRRARGLQHIDRLLPARRRRLPEPARVVMTRRHSGLGHARRDFAVGSAVGAAGAAPATAGILGLSHDRAQRKRLLAKRDTFDPYDFVATGVRGTVDANRKALRSRPADRTQPHRKLAGAATAGLVLGASALGGQASRRLAPHLIAPHFHPAAHAVAGTVAGASAIPTAHHITSHVIRRKKRAAVRPSSRSVRVEGRDNHPVRKMMDASEVHINGPLMLATNRKRKLKIPAAVTVEKADDAPVPNPAQARRQLRRKKRQFGLSALATGGGIAALGGSIAASRHANLPVNIAHRAGKIAVKGGAVAGGAGSAAAVEGLQIQRRELKQQAQLLPPKH